MLWLIDVDYAPLTSDYSMSSIIPTQDTFYKSSSSQIERDPNQDLELTAYDIRFVYSQVEVCLAIATASAPALRPVFARWFPRLFSSGSKSGAHGYRYGDNPYGQYGGRSTVGATSGGTTNTNTNNKTPTAVRSAFPLRDLTGRRGDRTEIRTQSPTSSEEEIMTYHGIMRKTDITVQIERGSSLEYAADREGKRTTPTDRIGNAV